MDALKMLMWIMSGGWAKDYRTQLVGMVTALTAILNAVQAWAVGDPNGSLMDLLHAIGANWVPLVTGLTIWFGGDKINSAIEKPTLIVKK